MGLAAPRQGSIYCSQPDGLNSTQWTRCEYMESQNPGQFSHSKGDKGGILFSQNCSQHEPCFNNGRHSAALMVASIFLGRQGRTP